MVSGRHPIFIRAAGEIYGDWTVLDPTRDRLSRVLVRCKCGKVRRVWAAGLVRGKSRSCQSCANSRSNSKRLVYRVSKGDRFGIWTVVKSRRGSRAMVPLICDHGHTNQRVLQLLVEKRAKRCRPCEGAWYAISTAKRYVECDGKRISIGRLHKFRGTVIVHATSIEFVPDRKQPAIRDEVIEMIDEAQGPVDKAFWEDHRRPAK